MFRKGVSTTLLGLLLGVLLLAIIIPTNASAAVKSETIKVDDSIGFSFSLQLKGDEKVHWEWSAEPEETGDDPTTDFSITDEDDDSVAFVTGKTSDSGSVIVEYDGTFYFSWEPEDDVMLSYTITYEPMTDESIICCGSILAIIGILMIVSVVGFVFRRK